MPFAIRCISIWLNNTADKKKKKKDLNIKYRLELYVDNCLIFQMIVK